MALATIKAHRFLPTEAPSHPRHINDSAFGKNCMLESSTSAPRKRARLEHHTDQQSDVLFSNKRRKPSPSSEPPPAFWDNLSKIWLTKRALRELDKRNSQAVPIASCTSEPGRANHLRSDDPSILKAWKKFSRHGGPDLSGLRNFPEPTHITKSTMSASRSSTRSQRTECASTRPTTNTSRTKSTGAYDRNFQQHLIDYNIFPDAYEYPNGSVPAEPNNWDDLQQILAQPRPSLSPSQFTKQEFIMFKKANAHATKEKQVSELVIPVIEGTIEDARCRSGGIPFTNLDPLTDGTLKPGNPDIYYGARPEQLSRQVRTELSSHIVPSTQHDLPMAPNFFLAAKGPDGSIAVAERQACYDGALGARGMASLETYGQGQSGYGTACAISSIYHGGQLKMFTSHITQSSPGSRPEYHMTQLNTWGLTGNADTFRQGATAYRNARDWAKAQRDNLINQANERATLAEFETPLNDHEADASPALSFVTAASDTEAYTMSQASRTTLNEGSNALGIFEESDSSVESLADHSLADHSLAAKQSNKRKRRSNDAESKA